MRAAEMRSEFRIQTRISPLTPHPAFLTCNLQLLEIPHPASASPLPLPPSLPAPYHIDVPQPRKLPMRISKVGVIGAGVMGHGIAALCASAGIPVVLLDIPGSDDPKSPDRSTPAKNGLLKAIKSKPAGALENDPAAPVTPGNTDDDIDRKSVV